MKELKANAFAIASLVTIGTMATIFVAETIRSFIRMTQGVDIGPLGGLAFFLGPTVTAVGAIGLASRHAKPRR